MSGALAGRAVLLTRPAGMSGRLAEIVRAEGGEAVLLPVIEILPPADSAALEATIARLERFDIAIFVSPTAVARANTAVGVRQGWPARLRYAAVGTGTAAALREIGITGVLAPHGRGDSEALAALPALADIAGRRIVIFRGQGGREALRESLVARGAEVEYAECYRRAMPHPDIAPLTARWRQGKIDAVSITSAGGLENLFALLGPEGACLLRATPVFVPHPRVGDAARRLDIERVILTGAGDEDLAEALAVFFAKVSDSRERNSSPPRHGRTERADKT